jgi:hypothetical protein
VLDPKRPIREADIVSRLIGRPTIISKQSRERPLLSCCWEDRLSGASTLPPVAINRHDSP